MSGGWQDYRLVAIGMQLVKREFKNQLINDALSYGRILSFDFAAAATRSAISTEVEVETFFTRLMIYYLCRLFDGTQVDVINFENLEFRDMVGTISQQPTFNDWLQQCLQRGADRMMKGIFA